MTHAELALQATLLVACLGCMAGLILAGLAELAGWLRVRLAKRAALRAQVRARYGRILS